MGKCRQNTVLSKNRLTNVDDDTVEVSETAVSSCDDDKRFDDGTDRERIKCTVSHERGVVWSHKEYDCHGA